MKPAIPLTNPAFKYVNSASTDLRKTFARVRKEMAEQKREADAVVRTLKTRKA